MSYKKLEIWQEAEELVLDVHRMTVSALPKFEMYETGSQLRRSIKAVKANIVEGYGRRRYKKDYIRFLTYALASTIESLDHLETLFKTRSLKDDEQYSSLHQRLEVLGKKINNFIRGVENHY